MSIRNDLGRGRHTPPPIPTSPPAAPDAVLYECPQCRQVHFVRVGPCPSFRQAVREQAEALKVGDWTAPRG